MSAATRGTETGDRHAFLARAFARGARAHAANVAHPLPDAVTYESGFVPIGYRTLDPADLVGSFTDNATAALLNVERVSAVTDEFLRAHIEEQDIRSAVVSRAPAAQAVGARLEALGVSVSAYSRDAAVTADLGVSAPAFGIAATGSLVQDSTVEGGRGISLVPRMHLAVLPVASIVATTADVFATFVGRVGGMPSNVVLITGPSRTGDIEMILTVGVHGPVKVIVALVD